MATAGGGFDDAVFEAGEEAGTMRAEPGENVGSETAVVGAGFDELIADRRWEMGDGGVLEPLGELEGEEFAQERSDTDAGNVITAAADVVSFLFIISTIWTVKGQFHEAGEGDDAAAAYLFCNDFREIFQLLVEWCGFSY